MNKTLVTTRGITMGRRDARHLLAALFVVAALGMPIPALATPNRPDPSFTRTKDGLAKVIVTYRDQVTAEDTAALRRAGGLIRRAFSIIPAIAADLADAQVSALRKNPRVLRVEPNADLQLFSDPELANSWGVARMGAGVVHTDPAGNVGAGVRVAVIDSGLAYSHPDLNARYAGGWNFVARTADPWDDNGHGTHVAGIIAAELDNVAETQAALGQNGVVGVAPGASIYALKVVDSTGNGDYAQLIEALEWSVAHDMQVVNISLGAHVDTIALHDAVRATYNAGIVVVAASGNVVTLQDILYGCQVAYPAAYSEAIAVSFTNTSDSLTGMSCIGPQVFLAAPGDWVTSTVPTGSCMFCSATGYSSQSGTSMASPHVAGLAALLVAKGLPDVNADGRINDEVRQQLCESTVPGAGTTDPRYHDKYGCGVANAYGAVVGDLFDSSGSAPAGAFTSPAPGETLTTTSSVNTFTWTEDDAGSGTWHRTLTQERGTVVNPGTCNGVSWQTRWTETYTSPFTTGGYAAGYCYRYSLQLTNGAQLTSTIDSGELLVQSGPPPQPDAAFTKPAPGDLVISNNGTNTVEWTESDGGGGGIASRTLTQQRGAILSPGSCAGVTWQTRWSESHTSPFTTAGYLAGYCYRYSLTVTNAAGGTATAISGDLLIGPPEPPSAVFTSPVLGQTVVSTSSTNTVTWMESDGGGGISSRSLTQQRGALVNPGTCAGITWETRWTGSYTSPFTTTGYSAGYCYRYTLTITNAGGTATAESGDLLIEPPPLPSATFTLPATGDTVETTSATNTVTWTESDGGGQGIASRTLTQERGAITTAGTCAGVTWQTRWSGSYTSPFTTTGYAAGYCYRYRLSLTNTAGGTFVTTSGNLLVASPAPPSATFTSPAAGETIVTTSKTNTITWIEDGGAGGAIVSRTLTQQRGAIVTPGSCVGVTWQTRWSAAYTSPFTTGGYATGYCYRYVLTITNAAGGSATATSGNLLVSKR